MMQGVCGLVCAWSADEDSAAFPPSPPMAMPSSSAIGYGTLREDRLFSLFVLSSALLHSHSFIYNSLSSMD